MLLTDCELSFSCHSCYLIITKSGIKFVSWLRAICSSPSLLYSLWAVLFVQFDYIKSGIYWELLSFIIVCFHQHFRFLCHSCELPSSICCSSPSLLYSLWAVFFVQFDYIKSGICWELLSFIIVCFQQHFRFLFHSLWAVWFPTLWNPFLKKNFTN